METGNPTIDAQTAFARQRRARRRRRVVGWLTGRRRASSHLPTLDDALGPAPVGTRREVGLTAVPLRSIVGTAECAKARAFDAAFRPPASSRRRWEGLWIAGRRGAALPPISVYRVRGRHFVGDGHHRVSVARALGMDAIDAEVIELGPVRSRGAGGRPSCF
ncbi:MAG: hypothetical protein ACRDL0_11340 [Thermoleophilaceae bacterium]